MLPLLLTAAAAAAGAAGSYLEGKSAQQAGEFNAAQKRIQAGDARIQGAREAYQQDIVGRMGVARTRAGYAGAGVTMEGSPAEVLYMGEAAREIDKLNILQGSERQAKALEQGADMDIAQGTAAYTAGLWKAGGQLLSGAKDAYSSYGGGPSSGGPSNVSSAGQARMQSYSSKVRF